MPGRIKGQPKGKPPFKRVCPSCGVLVLHSGRQNRNSAVRLKKKCRACEYLRKKTAFLGEGNPFYGKKHTQQTISKLKSTEHPHVKTDGFKEGAAVRMRGAQNRMKGSSVYELWVNKFGSEKANELREARRQKSSLSASGRKNPMYGKPAPKGSGNGWSGWYKGWFFRSLRELSYMINSIEREGLSWRTAESAELKIPYAGHDGTPRNYRADFLIGGTVLVEIKPRKLHASPTVVLKRTAAEAFCAGVGLEYRLVDPPLLSDPEIISLHAAGRIRFTDRYEKKFLERFNQ